MRYAVLGAGRQGLAIAYDLARHGGAALVTLVDGDPATLRAGQARLKRLAPDVEVRGIARTLVGGDAGRLLRGHDVMVSALPYRLNPALAEAAVRARMHFCDLGGNTDLVLRALKLDRAAKRAGVAVVPDCGLAPGLGNVLAALAVAETKRARDVRVWCGGLPVPPKGPLGYSLLFDIAGLTNEYTGEAVVLRKGRVRRIEAFTEPEEFAGPRRLGALEAFVTSGGTSTAPWTFAKRLRTYEYKTVRYAGHYAKVRAMIELGLLELDPVQVGTQRVVPREVFHAVAGPRLRDPGVKDVAILRVECTDARGRGVRYEMLQPFDGKTGFTAMEQTTGYPTAAIAHLLAAGAIGPGARTPERLGLGADHVRALRKRGLKIRRTAIGG